MADRKEEIIQAGIEVFSVKGYYNTHIADIVSLVGIAKGTFYLYFKSKKSLFIALIKKFERIFFDAYKTNVLEKDDNLKSFFNDMLINIFGLYKTNKKLSIIILRESVAVNEEFESEFKKMDQKRFQKLKLLYEFLLKNKLIDDKIGFEYFACTFVGIMESIVLRRLLLYENDFDIKEAADKISDYLFKALSK